MRLSPPETITARHRERRASLSIRPSDPQRARHKRGSRDTPGTRLRVALAQRAVGPGWVPEQVQVAGDDRGHSSLEEERQGSRGLGSAGSSGQVGLVLASEARRPARANADW